MLKSLHLKDFTVFSDANFQFGRHLNVIVGENGLGKTHLLKVAYSITAVSARGAKETGSPVPTKSYLQTALASKLRGVFKPDELGRLARRRPGRTRSEVSCEFGRTTFDLKFSFNGSSKSEVTVDQAPTKWMDEVPVYLPTRELLTIHPGLVSLFETTQLPFEETWRDTAILLGAPPARGARESKIRELLKPLEEMMGGRVITDSLGRFYLRTGSERVEMHLVAEGHRKLATVATLIATGSLLDKGYLFWDEPESNLNPKIIKTIARAILQVAGSGIQVFIATHSLFLMRELDILLNGAEFSRLDARFFGLHLDIDGVNVEQGPDVDSIGDITALQEELSQSDRYLETTEAHD